MSQYSDTMTDTMDRKVKVSHWDINYIKVGCGPHTVFCMPATFGTIWTHFKILVEEFDKEQFTLVVWDPPGYGKSRPPERDGYPVDFYETDADLAYEFIRALGITKCSILGWCGGGISAMILAAKHPEVVHKLIVWAASAFLLPKELERYRANADPQTWPERAKAIAVAKYGIDLICKYYTMFVEGLENMHKERGNMCSDFLKHIKCPTLIMHGEVDKTVDKSHVDYLREHIEGSRVHLYPDGGHYFHITHAQDFNTRVQEFLLEP